MRRILVACSLIASAVSAFAGYSDLREFKTADGQVAHVVAKGQFIVQQDGQQQIAQQFKQEVAVEKPIVLSNQTALEKYGTIQRDDSPANFAHAVNSLSSYNTPVSSSPSTPNFSSNNSSLSWLQVHPLRDGRVSSNFGTRVMGGKREGHSGLDIAAPTGTPIVATGPGQVTKAGWGTGYGRYVEIRHNDGYVTRYAHASRLHVSVGDWVEAGQHIANVGCSGRCTGPHLHYEVVKDGRRQNPARYLAMLP